MCIFSKTIEEDKFWAHIYYCNSVALDSFDKNGFGHILDDFHKTLLVTLIFSSSGCYAAMESLLKVLHFRDADFPVKFRSPS
jgi:hypothetical protein